jgi:catechol 2,3-dioxygenase-like lactoylglutathione lyase family enzyme
VGICYAELPTQPAETAGGPDAGADLQMTRIGETFEIYVADGSASVEGCLVLAEVRLAADGSLTVDSDGPRRILPSIGGPPPRTYTAAMNWKIELVAIPVTDVDRAKAFYVDQVGFNADHDVQVSEALRFVQLTPPGSACSIVMGTGITEMPPGSQKGVQVVVEDVESARRELIGRGVAASDVDVQPWGSFVRFSDPDGNTWSLQQLPPWA